MAEPTLECDLVMRGGVTSGIVYPSAVAALSATYRFRSVGGTSAGAIAAVVTAAAEFGRRSGRNVDAFRQIEAMPAEFGAETASGKPFLFHLFTPNPTTAPLFNLVVSAAQTKGLREIGAAILPALPGKGSGILAAGALAFAVSALFLLLLGSGWLAMILGALPFAAIAMIASAALWAREWLPAQASALKANGYAFCSGMQSWHADSAEKSRRPGALPTVPGLTPWMHDVIQSAAGLTGETPLTFGDLWRAHECRELRGHQIFKQAGGVSPRPAPDEDDASSSDSDETDGAKSNAARAFDVKSRDVELILMTTDLTRGLSAQMPFFQNVGELYFLESDLSALLPTPVIDWLKQASPGNLEYKGQTYIQLPRARDLPVVLAARMSLSFPFLLSAVKFYIKQRSRDEFRLRPIWFSDGGITSNFPIHFFDAPIPSRPTFCINLVPEDTDLAVVPVDPELPGSSPSEIPENDLKDSARTQGTSEDSGGLVRLYNDNTTGSVMLNNFATESPFGSLFGFVMAIIDTARLWGDNELMRLPGYRERIVHIALRDNEGGFNLAMPKDVISNLAKRGQYAGQLIGDTFNPAKTQTVSGGISHGFANHRWVRFRSFMAAFEALGRQFVTSYDASDKAGAPTFDEMIESEKDGSRKIGFRLIDAQQPFIRAQSKALAELMRAWSKATVDSGDKQAFDRGKRSNSGRSPRPKPTLRMRPPGNNDPRTEFIDPIG